MPDGRRSKRLACHVRSDSIKRLADWYNGLPSADETYREDGAVYGSTRFLLRLHSRRTGSRHAPGQDGKAPGAAPDLPAIATLAHNGLRRTGRRGPWRPFAPDAPFRRPRFDLWVYNVDQVERMVAARWREQGWLFPAEVGKDQGLLPNAFQAWRFRGFPRGAPSRTGGGYAARQPTVEPSGATCTRPRASRGWQTGTTDFRQPTKRTGKTGPFTGSAQFLLRLHSRRTGKRRHAPSGKMEGPRARPDPSAIATLAQNGLRRTGRRGP